MAKIFCSLTGKYFHDVINEINFNNCSYSGPESVGDGLFGERFISPPTTSCLFI